MLDFRTPMECIVQIFHSNKVKYQDLDQIYFKEDHNHK